MFLKKFIIGFFILIIAGLVIAGVIMKNKESDLKWQK